MSESESFFIANEATVNVEFTNTFLCLFSNKMLVFSSGIHKMLVRIAKGEGTDQTASSEAV